MPALEVRSWIVVVAFTLYAVACAATVPADMAYLRYIEAALSGSLLDAARLRVEAPWNSPIRPLQEFLWWISVAVFLAWFHRAHANLAEARLPDLRYRPRWTVIGFCVPFVNLVRPYQVMAEVWRGSRLIGGQASAMTSKLTSVSPLVICWWLLFLPIFIVRHVLRPLLDLPLFFPDLYYDEWSADVTRLTLVSDIAPLPAGMLALLVIRRVTRLQKCLQDPQVKRQMRISAMSA